MISKILFKIGYAGAGFFILVSMIGLGGMLAGDSVAPFPTLVLRFSVISLFGILPNLLGNYLDKRKLWDLRDEKDLMITGFIGIGCLIVSIGLLVHRPR